MVDWDRVEELRSKGWDWDRIAADPKVGFHPDTSVREAGRALRGLYHRQKSRQRRQGSETPTPSPRKSTEVEKPRWNATRIGWLLVPIVGIWALFAYVLPSPVGVVVPAIPYLALAFAVVVAILLLALWRSGQERWSKPLRKTVIIGVVVGLVVSGVIALTGALFFGCPVLPPSSSQTTQPGGLGWTSVPASAWQDGGKPVFYFYGATWCPYCSASSWAMWKALTEFQSGFDGSTSGVPGTSFYYSNPGDVYPSTPEVILASASVSSPAMSFQVSEYYWTQTNGATAGTFPGTSNCIQQAYVSAYSGGSIPFVVLNGQFVHAGASLIDPSSLSSWAVNGAPTVATDVLQESGTPWSIVQSQAGWICAFVIKADGFSSVSAFLSANPGLNGRQAQFQWTTTMTGLVNSDLGQIT
jgi:hypothetical protein